jgi:hypothetical protein
MTLGQALRVLHERGRIAAPWLPGMLLTDELSSSMVVRLAWADEVYWHGAYGRNGNKPISGGWLRIRRSNASDYTPDTTDPATVGCLAALAREALRDPAAHARPSAGAMWTAEFPRLLVGYRADTEGEAWARALLQLADELTRGEVLRG